MTKYDFYDIIHKNVLWRKNWVDIDLSKTQKYLDWLKRKLYLDKLSEKSKTRVVKRGQVYWCDFGIGIGSEMSKESPRPCIVLQQTVVNIKSPNTIVIPVTHDTGHLPCLIPIRDYYSDEGDLILGGQANVSNIVCISKSRLGDFIADLDNSEINNIKIAIATQLGIYSKYKSLKDKINSKDEYIKRLKEQRNDAQDELESIRKMLKISKDNDIIKELEKILDKTQKV